MRKAEKWFMIILFSVIVGGLIIIPVGENVYNNIRTDIIHKKHKITHLYTDIYNAVGAKGGEFNRDDNWYLQKPYYLNIENITIYPMWLQMNVNAYNNYYELNTGEEFKTIQLKDQPEFKRIDAKEIEKEFYYMLENNWEVGEDLNSFGVWYSIADKYIDYYIDQLNEVCDLYEESHPEEFPENIYSINLFELTPEQINLLDKVYREKTTVEDIDLQLTEDQIWIR